MKRVSLLAVGVLILLMATGALAQDSFRLKADIPFDFAIGPTSFPAGEYTVRGGIGSTTSILLFQKADGRSGVFTMTNPAQWNKPEEPRPMMVFYKYGDRYFLAQLWTGDGYGRELQKSREEREITFVSEPASTQFASVALHR